MTDRSPYIVRLRAAGLVLLGVWIGAWYVVSRPVEPEPILVEKTMIAGGDVAAVAWREEQPGVHLWLRTAVAAGDAVVTKPPIDLAPKDEFELVEAGPGRFLLRISRPDRRRIDFVRFDRDRVEELPPLEWTAGDIEAFAAAGDEAALVLRDANDRYRHELYLLSPSREWRHGRVGKSIVLGGGASHVVAYWPDATWGSEALDDLEAGTGETLALNVMVRPPDCVTQKPEEWERPKVLSVVAFDDGWARLSRVGDLFGSKSVVGCIDGERGGKRFEYRDLAIGALDRLRVGDGGRLRLDAAAQGGAYGLLTDDGHLIAERDPVIHDGLRIAGARVETALTAKGGENGYTVTLVRKMEAPPPASTQLAPDPPRVAKRPLRLAAPLVLLPLSLLAGSLAFAIRPWRRLRARPAPVEKSVLPAGRAAIEGVVEVDAEAPRGALRVRRGSESLWLFIEGAEVVRATDLRGAGELGGDAVDVAAGATIYAEGQVDPGSAFRGESTLRAGAGDLVLAGCTLGEARARAARRVWISAALLVAAALGAGAAVAAVARLLAP